MFGSRAHRSQSCLILNIEKGRNKRTTHEQRQKYVQNGRELLGVTEIAFAGEREMGLSPLLSALEVPRLVTGGRFEAQPIDAAVDEMSKTGAGVRATKGHQPEGDVGEAKEQAPSPTTAE